MDEVVLLSSGHGHGGDSMGVANYLSPAGRALPRGARLMLRDDKDRERRFLYEFALIAEARGHRMFPSARAQLHRNRILRSPEGEGSRLSASRAMQDGPRQDGPRVAVIFDPADAFTPSSPETLSLLCAAFEDQGLQTHIVDPSTRDPVSADALFIRTYTHPDNEAFGWAAEAEDAGLACLDDSVSIIRSCSKLYQMEAFACAGVSAPQGMCLINRADQRRAADQIGFPLVVKAPDSSFSRSVHRARNAAELRDLCDLLWVMHPILIAQKYTPTDFDWRIGVLNGEPLYACKYFMAEGHWQIIKQDGESPLEGRGSVVALPNAPAHVLDLAVRAAACIGEGLYGVDIKAVGEGATVIEVNDNPTIEHDLEAAVDPVWTRLASHFHAAIRARRENPPARREKRYA